MFSPTAVIAPQPAIVIPTSPPSAGNSRATAAAGLRIHRQFSGGDELAVASDCATDESHRAEPFAFADFDFQSFFARGAGVNVKVSDCREHSQRRWLTA